MLLATAATMLALWRPAGSGLGYSAGVAIGAIAALEDLPQDTQRAEAEDPPSSSRARPSATQPVGDSVVDVRLTTGERVLVNPTSAELRDAGGRVMLRYEAGVLLLSAPAGDVVFAAPSGKIVFEAGQDVAFSAARDIVQRAGRGVSLAAGEDARSRLSVEPTGAQLIAPRVDVRTATTSADLGEATIAATHARTTTKTWSLVTERFEVSATRIIEKAQDTFRDVAELAQTRVGRARTLVRDVYALYTRRTTMTSKDDTRVDGKRIHLG